MAVEAAPWWNPDSPQDGKPLVRHAPTLSHYHNPDDRQLSLMRSGIGTPVVVPKATADGASPAFSAHEAGVVHVDPDAPDGGVVVDLTHLDRRSMRTALAQSSFPHQVFYQLGVPPNQVNRGFGRTGVGAAEPARQNPLMPSSYVVPKAAQDGRQEDGYYAHTPGFGPTVPTVVNGYHPPLPTPAYQAAQESQMFPPVPQIPAPQPVGPAPAPPQVQQYAAQPQPQPQQYAPQPQQYAPPPAPPQYPQPPQYQYPPQPAPMDPAFAAMMAQMQQAMSGLANGLGAVNQKVAELAAGPPRLPAPSASIAARARTRPADDNPYRQDAGATFDDSTVRPIPRSRQGEEEGVGRGRDDKAWDLSPEPARRQTLADLKDDGPRDGIIVGFESLRLPYVLGPKGVKPRRQVFFELPQVGNHSVRYHDVIVAKNSLALVYDTRYEDGDMYMPPEMGETEVNVHVPHLKKTFKVTSVGLTFPMGAFDLVILPKHAEETLDMGTEDR